MNPRRALLALGLVLCAGASWAQVHRWVDERGVVHYGDRPAVTEGVSTLRVPTSPRQAIAPSGPLNAPPAQPPVNRTAQRSAQAAPTAQPGPARTSYVDQQLAAASRPRDAAAPPDPNSPGMKQLIVQCKANRGVDCDTPQGQRNLQRENTPITAQEQARIAGLRAQRASCARAGGGLGCP